MLISAVKVSLTLSASLSGTFLQALPDLVTPLKGHSQFISAQLSSDAVIVQVLCESRGGRPGLSVLTSLLVSVDVKLIQPCFGIGFSLSLICQLTSEDIKQHYLSSDAVSAL